MKKLYGLFFSCCLLAILNLSLQSMGAGLPEFFRYYLNDLLALPIVLFICLVLTRFLYKDRNIKLGLFSVLSVATLYSVYFEYYLPDRSARYTGDIVDVFLYFFGALVFYIVQPKNTTLPAKNSNDQKRDFSEIEE